MKMNFIRKVRRDFVRQLGENDCGMACVAMILNYAGKRSDVQKLRTSIQAVTPLTLLELKKIAMTVALEAKCVEMDSMFLRTITSPVILHTAIESGMNHYQVCFGAYSKNERFHFVVADPAEGVNIIDEVELNSLWISRAAIYFSNLPDRSLNKSSNPWTIFLSNAFVPKMLFIAVPAINLFAAGLGMSISWILQKGMNQSLTNNNNRIFVLILILLSIITFAKGGLIFVRQRILIKVNHRINEQLTVHLFEGRLQHLNESGVVNLLSVKSQMIEIQKVQNAFSLFVATLLSDGSMLVLLLGVAFYNSLLLGVVSLSYLIIILILTIRTVPRYKQNYAHLNQLSGYTEKVFVKDATMNKLDKSGLQFRLELHKSNHKRYLDYGQEIAHSMTRSNLLFECLGTICVIITLGFSLFQLNEELIGYPTFMLSVIVAYITTGLMPKISTSILTISENLESAGTIQAIM